MTSLLTSRYRFGALLLLMGLLAAGPLPARAGVRQIADAQHSSESFEINSAGQVAWWLNGVLYFWDGDTLHEYSDLGPPPDNTPWYLSDSGQIVWEGQTGSRRDIYLWNGASVRLLSRDTQDNRGPHINPSGLVVWKGDDQIYLWDGTSVRQLTQTPIIDDGGETDDQVLQINAAGQVVWESGFQIYLWDGVKTQSLVPTLPVEKLIGSHPQINAVGHVVWEGAVYSDTVGIYLWDGAVASRLSPPTVPGFAPRISDGGPVSWLGIDSSGQQASLYLWDGAQVHLLTQLLNRARAYQINRSGQVAWQEAGSRRALFWDGNSTRMITDQSGTGVPQLNDAGQVLWESGGGSTDLFLWDGRSNRQISNDRGREGPRAFVDGALINRAGQVVWRNWGTGLMDLYTPPAPGSLELEPPVILEGRTALGTITLPQPAPPGGAGVALASDSPAAVVPASVTVPAGAVAANFLVTTTSPSPPVTATITASYGGNILTAVLALTP